MISYTSFFLISYLLILRERGREGERAERNINVWLPLSHLPTGDLASNPGMCPEGASTGDPLVHRPALNPLSHTSWATIFFLLMVSLIY